MNATSATGKSVARRFLGICRLALLVALVACGNGEQMVLRHSLLEELPGLETSRETASIDLGADDARSLLLRGFSEISFDTARNRHFVRGIGKRSVVRFTLLEARDLELVLEARPVPREVNQRVEIAVNREVIGALDLKPRLADYTVRVPASAVRRGENLLYLTYSGEAEVVAWYAFQFALGAPGTLLPSTNLSAGSLLLPFGSQMTLPLLAPPGAELRFREIAVRGGQGRLKVDVRRDDRQDRTIEMTQDPDGASYDLGVDAWTPLRLTLTALADQTAGPRDGVALVEPAVWAPERYRGVSDPPPATTSSRRPNVIVYLVDTLRPDRLGAYGYERPVSPEIDAFSARATLFENALAQTSWTRPAVVSVFTGMWPAAHGVNRGRDQLAPETTTLAEVLEETGYETVAFVSNPNVYRKFGLDQGFETYRHVPGKKAPSDKINREVRAWLDSRHPGNPFFLYVHTVDPHDPYEPPESYRNRFAPGSEGILALPGKARWAKANRQVLSDLYDAEIAFNDASFGELIADLRTRDLWDQSLVIFLSDHGEEFLEHGAWTHGRALFDESVRIPLIVKWPGQREGTRRTDLAQQIDVPSTILSELGLEWPEAFEGRDLSVEARDTPRSAFAYLNYYGPLQLSVVRDEWKYLVRVDKKTAWLFDRGQDPEETEDHSHAHPILTDVFDAELAAALRPRPYWLNGGEAEIDKQLEDQLRALGYLN